MSFGSVEKDRIRTLLAERAMRKKDALRIFRPLPYQEPVFRSLASELLVRGGNRSGKTLCTAAEVASAATGIPLTDSKGNEIPFKYPKDRPLLIWLIGYGSDHIGQTFHRMLFRRNPELKMIQDPETGEWRAYKPWQEWDYDNKHLARPAPPYIPARLIQSWSWQNKADRHFNVCKLKPRPEFGHGSEGTEIHAFTSKGEPKMGDPVDLIWIDERIQFSKHYSEWQARISDRGGRIVWSLWPGNVNQAVLDLHRRAQEEKENNPHDPDVEEVILTFTGNPFIPDREKNKRIKGWSDEERRSRDQGEFVKGSVQIYPNFAKQVHLTPCVEEDNDDEVDRILRKRGGQIPEDWRRDLILDPGHSHPGILLVAVPPPEICHGETIGIVYEEVYLPQSDADAQAKAIAPKVAGHPLASKIIDWHAGRQTPIGFSLTVAEQYTNAFKRYNISSENTGYGFQWSSDDVNGGINLVREMLLIGPHGRPRLRVTKNCENFILQMDLYTKAQDAHGFTQDKPASNQIDPLCDCIRYWAGAHIKYQRPRPGSGKQPSPQYRYFMKHWKEKEDDSGTIILGNKE